MKKTLHTLILILVLGWQASAQNSHWTIFNTANSEIGGNTILALTTDEKNNLWVGTNLGLCRLSNRTWTDYAMFNEKLKDQFVNCLTTDHEGNLWIGTDDYGVIEFDGSQWTEYSKETKKLNMKFVKDIAIDRRGTRWIGVTLSGLVQAEGRGDWKKFTAAESDLLSDFILFVVIDSQNRKWIGTNEGLCVLDGNGWESFTMRNSPLPSNNVTAMVIDPKGVKWIGTLGGLCRFENGEWTVHSTSNSPIPSDQINALAIDEGGSIWMATDKGVAVFDGRSNWHIYSKTDSPLPSNMVQELTIDRKGNKWFGTDFYGLARFSGQGIEGTVTDEGSRPLSNITVRCGDFETKTNPEGKFYFEVPTGTTVVIAPDAEGLIPSPQEIRLQGVNTHQFGQNFVLGHGAEPAQKGQKVMINPFLSEGYITITLETHEAEIEFVDASGKSIRTIPRYISGNRITISKMPKGMYDLHIRTSKGEKTLKFNLK